MTEVCVIEDKTAVVLVASHCSVSRNPVRFNALAGCKESQEESKKKNCLHPWVKVDQAVRPLPQKRLSILKAQH